MHEKKDSSKRRQKRRLPLDPSITQEINAIGVRNRLSDGREYDFPENVYIIWTDDERPVLIHGERCDLQIAAYPTGAQAKRGIEELVNRRLWDPNSLKLVQITWVSLINLARMLQIPYQKDKSIKDQPPLIGIALKTEQGWNRISGRTLDQFDW